MTPYRLPNNATEYWAIIDSHWEDISLILDIYLPTFARQWIDRSTLQTTLHDYLNQLRLERKPKLIRAFHAALWNIPEDNAGEWYHAGYNQLRDLCTEEYVIYEPREELDQ